MTILSQAITAYRSGSSLRDLVAEFGHTPPTWRNRLRAAGVTLRPAGSSSSQSRLVRQKVLALAETRMKQAEIARAVGISPQRVWQIIRESKRG
jgi:lambda repressor-like predicted transcriptional regulator